MALKSPLSYHTIPANEDGTPIPLVVSPSQGMTVKNGSSGTIAVKLPVQPSQSVTVKTTVVDGSNQLSVTGGASLTFTTGNWNTPQNVTVQSVSGQAGWQRVLIAASGADLPGFGGVFVHILVS